MGGPPVMLATPTANFCTQKWCYVDPCNCTIAATASTTFNHLSSDKMYYSYDACGENDTWTEENTDNVVGGAECEEDECMAASGSSWKNKKCKRECQDADKCDSGCAKKCAGCAC